MQEVWVGKDTMRKKGSRGTGRIFKNIEAIKTGREKGGSGGVDSRTHAAREEEQKRGRRR